MPIPPDVLSKLGELQNLVWQTASLKTSETAGFEIQFSNPLTLPVPAADVFAESTSPRLVVQFGLSGMTDNAMVFLLPRETFGSIVTALKGAIPEEVDESLIPDVKPFIEAIVQSVCQTVSNLKGEPVVAGDLNIRYQIPSFPANLQRNEELVRTNVAVSNEEFSGTLTWILDPETAHNVVGIEFDESNSNARTAKNGDQPSADEASLDIIMDIPLEVSVELGRVKMQVRDVVELGAGSIVEIDKAAGEPVDVLVNGRLVARGEVVVIDDNFGVRITEILSIQERLQKLNEAA